MSLEPVQPALTRLEGRCSIYPGDHAEIVLLELLEHLHDCGGWSPRSRVRAHIAGMRSSPCRPSAGRNDALLAADGVA